VITASDSAIGISLLYMGATLIMGLLAVPLGAVLAFLLVTREAEGRRLREESAAAQARPTTPSSALTARGAAHCRIRRWS
jgi:hypothetical protein